MKMAYIFAMSPALVIALEACKAEMIGEAIRHMLSETFAHHSLAALICTHGLKQLQCQTETTEQNKVKACKFLHDSPRLHRRQASSYDGASVLVVY